MPGVDGAGHGLLAHLTLVHVAGGLVEVGEGDGAGQVGEEAGGPDLAVRGQAGQRLALSHGNLQVDLLEGADVFHTVGGNVPHGSHHPGGAGEDEQTRKLAWSEIRIKFNAYKAASTKCN